jgi:hypothetical protein
LRPCRFCGQEKSDVRFESFASPTRVVLRIGRDFTGLALRPSRRRLQTFWSPLSTVVHLRRQRRVRCRDRYPGDDGDDQQDDQTNNQHFKLLRFEARADRPADAGTTARRKPPLPEEEASSNGMPDCCFDVAHDLLAARAAADEDAAPKNRRKPRPPRGVERKTPATGLFGICRAAELATQRPFNTSCVQLAAASRPAAADRLPEGETPRTGRLTSRQLSEVKFFMPRHSSDLSRAPGAPEAQCFDDREKTKEAAGHLGRFCKRSLAANS